MIFCNQPLDIKICPGVTESDQEHERRYLTPVIFSENTHRCDCRMVPERCQVSDRSQGRVQRQRSPIAAPDVTKRRTLFRTYLATDQTVRSSNEKRPFAQSSHFPDDVRRVVIVLLLARSIFASRANTLVSSRRRWSTTESLWSSPGGNRSRRRPNPFARFFERSIADGSESLESRRRPVGKRSPSFRDVDRISHRSNAFALRRRRRRGRRARRSSRFFV